MSKTLPIGVLRQNEQQQGGNEARKALTAVANYLQKSVKSAVLVDGGNNSEGNSDRPGKDGRSDR